MTNMIRRVSLGAVMVLVMSACSSDESAETTAASVAPASTTTEASSPTVAPTTTPATTVVAAGTSCVDCHTDEETLKALAVESVDTEHLSEGEG